MLRAIQLSSVLGLVLTLNAGLLADEAKGTIRSINNERKEVVLKGIVKDSIYELNKEATVWLDGARGKLSDLNPDDRAVIFYDKTGDRMMANQIRALRKAEEATGTVKETFKDKNEIILKGVVKNATYELNKDATVWVDGKKAALTDIRANDEVLVTYVQRGDHLMANDVTVLKRK